jgi:hypothetical protein
MLEILIGIAFSGMLLGVIKLMDYAVKLVDREVD